MNIKKINIGIKSLNESLEDFADTWKKLESGEKVKKEEGIYFESDYPFAVLNIHERIF